MQYWSETMSPYTIIIIRVILTFSAALFVMRALQATQIEKLFKPNSASQINTLIFVLSIVLGAAVANVIVDMISSFFLY